MQTIGFDRDSKGTFIETGADEGGLFVSLRVGVQGMTESGARAVPPAVKLRFAQPADLLDFADTCLDLAAAGYRAIDERSLADGVERLRGKWPIANGNGDRGRDSSPADPPMAP